MVLLAHEVDVVVLKKCDDVLHLMLVVLLLVPQSHELVVRFLFVVLLVPQCGERAHGDVAMVAETVEAFFAAGATTVVLQPYPDEQDLIGFSQRSGEVARMLGVARSSSGSPSV